MTLRTSDQQTEALRRQAAAEGRSTQAVALSAIDEYIARRAHRSKVESALQCVIVEEAAVLERLTGKQPCTGGRKQAAGAAAKNLPRVPLDDDVARKGQHTIHPKGTHMFTTRFIKSTAGMVLALGTLGFAVMAEAGTANADAVDDTYVAALAQAGIPQISPAAEISSGHAVCQNLDEGTTTPDRVIAAFVAKKVFATQQQDEAMVNASMTAYCPQYLPH